MLKKLREKSSPNVEPVQPAPEEMAPKPVVEPVPELTDSKNDDFSDTEDSLLIWDESMEASINAELDRLEGMKKQGPIFPLSLASAATTLQGDRSIPKNEPILKTATVSTRTECTVVEDTEMTDKKIAFASFLRNRLKDGRKDVSNSSQSVVIEPSEPLSQAKPPINVQKAALPHCEAHRHHLTMMLCLTLSTWPMIRRRLLLPINRNKIGSPLYTHQLPREARQLARLPRCGFRHRGPRKRRQRRVERMLLDK